MPIENRKYSDSVFVDLFYSDETAQENMRQLYNGMYDENLQDASQIQKFWVDDILCRLIKTDIGFLAANRRIIVHEQQSTVSMDMPMNLLLNISREYEKLYPTDMWYSDQKHMFPIPQFVVFYNGIKDEPLEKVLQLSDSFLEPESVFGKLKFEVPVINISYDKQHPLLNKCIVLREYSQLVAETREYGADKDKLEKAVKSCIKQGILSDYLKRKSGEVVNMLFNEYNYEMDIKVYNDDA